MKVAIEILTDDFRRLLDATSHDSNLRHVPVEQLIAEATKRGIVAWEALDRPSGSVPVDPNLDPASNLIATCQILTRAWEERGLDPTTPPDFRHILNAVRKMEQAGYRW